MLSKDWCLDCHWPAPFQGSGSTIVGVYSPTSRTWTYLVTVLRIGLLSLEATQTRCLWLPTKSWTVMFSMYENTCVQPLAQDQMPPLSPYFTFVMNKEWAVYSPNMLKYSCLQSIKPFQWITLSALILVSRHIYNYMYRLQHQPTPWLMPTTSKLFLHGKTERETIGRVTQIEFPFSVQLDKSRRE